jgi:hypothetical protein
MADLTSKATAKLERLKQIAADAQAAVQALMPRRQRTEEEHLAALRAADRSEDPALGRIADDIARRLAAIDDDLTARRERHLNAMAIIHRCNDFVTALPYRATVADVEPPAVAPVRGDLAAVRERIAFFKNAVAQVGELPPHGSEMRAFIEKYVAEMAERHTPRLDMRGKFVVDWNRVDVLGTPIGPMGVLCWAMPEVMVDRLMAEVTAQIGISDTVKSGAQRAELIDGVAKVLPVLELHEEALVEALLEGGVDVERRRDASPAAVLGVVVSNMPAAAAAA